MTDCPFCDFSKISSRTIATIDEINVVVTLGQITNGGYLLLVPFQHTPCLGALVKNKISSMEAVLSQTIAILEEEYGKPVIVFEHGIVGQTIKHLHLHLVPSNFDLTSQIASDFPNSEITEIKKLRDLYSEYHKRNQPYLLWSTPDNKTFACWNPPAPSEYLRLTTALMLGVPERGSWRKMNPVLDNALTEDTINRLLPYFEI